MATLTTSLPMTTRRVRRILAIGTLALASAFASAGLAPAGASAYHSSQGGPSWGCAHATMTPTRSTSSDFFMRGTIDMLTRMWAEKAVICLTNHERRAAGRSLLTSDYTGSHRSFALGTAARRHSDYMARADDFSHVTREGSTPVDRMLAAGYCTTASQCNPWNYYPGPENIRWGSGSLSTPLEAVKFWMNSTLHREALLDSRFTEIGVGVSLFAPTTYAGQAATYTQVFGSL